MKLLAFDVGGTEIMYAIVEDAVNISEKGCIPTPADRFEHFVDAIESIYRSCREEVEGIALSMPGPVDPSEGRMPALHRRRCAHSAWWIGCPRPAG